MDRKNLRLIIAGIWIIVAIIEFSRNQFLLAVLDIIVGLLFILMAVKSTTENVDEY